MALSFNSNTSECITFNEFIEETTKILKYPEKDAILDCTELLFKLANNKVFFAELLNEQLNLDLGNFQKGNHYSEQSFMLHMSKTFFIRMTFWPILSNNIKVSKSQEDLFSYGLAHDHNFSLLTAGYHGDGYKTKLWEYNYDDTIGYVGEKVNVKYLEEVTLGQNKALFYRPSKDIHAQYAPVLEDSLALNIILIDDLLAENRQYDFDIEKSTIKRILYGASMPKYGLLKLSTLINNDKTIDLLVQIATKHEIPQMRQEALQALFDIQGSDQVWKLGLEDRDKSVINFCKTKSDNVAIIK